MWSNFLYTNRVNRCTGSHLALDAIHRYTEHKGTRSTELHECRMMDTGPQRVSIIPSHASQSGYVSGHLSRYKCLGKMMVASSGQSGQSSLVRGAVWDAAEVSWRGPKCTTWQNKTLAYTGIIWQEVFVCGPKTKQYFLNKTKDGYARCAVCISPVLREVEGVLWPLKARTHGSILVDT